jgi:hypothetical protein
MPTISPTQSAVDAWNTERDIERLKATYSGPTLPIARRAMKRAQAAYRDAFGAPDENAAAEAYHAALLVCQDAVVHFATLERFEVELRRLQAAAKEAA